MINRRDMFKAGIAAGAIGLAPRLASAQATFAPVPKGWRSFVLTMQVDERCTKGYAIPSTAPRCCASNGRPISSRR